MRLRGADAQPGGLAGRGGPRGDADLGQHRGDVVVHGPLGDEQPLGRSPGPAGPPTSSARTSCSRAVSPAGAARVAGRGPRGIARIPSSFIRRRAAAAAAPGAEVIERAQGMPGARPHRRNPARPGRRHTAGPAGPTPPRRPASRRPAPGRMGSGRSGWRGRPRRWQPRQPDGQRPDVHGSSVPERRGRSPTWPRRPPGRAGRDSQLSSARAARTGAIHCGSPVPSASASASSSSSQPRRRRGGRGCVPRTRSGFSRFTGEMPGWSSICSADVRGLVPPPAAAAAHEPASPAGTVLNTPSSRSSQ